MPRKLIPMHPAPQMMHVIHVHPSDLDVEDLSHADGDAVGGPAASVGEHADEGYAFGGEWREG